MPIIQRLGSASTRGFGQFGGGGAYWVATLSSASGDIGRGIAVDSSGTVYVTGYSGVSGNYDIIIAKYNSTGTIQWQRSLSSAGTDYGYGIAVDASGNVYVTGEAAIGGVQTLILAKYNTTNGAIQWQRSLSIGIGATGQGVAVDSSGNVYVTGIFSPVGDNLILIAKYDSTGTIQWQRSLDLLPSGSTNDRGHAIAVNSSGVYVTGYFNYSGTSTQDIFLAKYDASGGIQWQRSLSSSAGTESGQGIAVDSNNNVYVSGSASGNMLLAKYNSSGTIQWQRTLGSGTGRGVAVDAIGNVYVTGYATVSGNTGIIIAKYNTSGAIQWQRSLNSASSDFGWGVAVDSSDNVYISGQNGDIILAKLPGNGSLTGTYTVGSTNFTYAVSTLTDAAGTLTPAISTLTPATSTLTPATSTLTDATSSLTSTVTKIP